MDQEVAPKGAAPAAAVAAPAGEAAHKPFQKCTSVKSIGVATDRNARYRRTMEDVHTIVDSLDSKPDMGFFAVYDGHGGKQAAEFAAQCLHENLLSALKGDQAGNVTNGLVSAFMATDDQMRERGILYAGCTAVAAVVTGSGDNRRLYTANVGDARAVLCRNGQAVRLSYDHKGNDETEAKRVIDAGGFMAGGRVNGILAVTRSLGDIAMKDYVLGHPYTTETALQPTDQFMILACDGLWDVVSDQAAVNMGMQIEDPQQLSEKLLEQALKDGSTDNISIMAVRF